MSAPGKPLVERPRRRDGYYIQASIKPYTRNASGRYDRAVWPILFETSEAAWMHLQMIDPALFQNAGGDGEAPCLIPGKTRIVSFSVERVRRRRRNRAPS